MGQRLTITFHTGNEQEPVAVAYWHWGAYTDSALIHTEEVLEAIEETAAKGETDPKKLAVEAVIQAEVGAMLMTKSYKDYRGKEPEPGYDPDGKCENGLIATDREEMKALQDWSVGDVYINLADPKDPKIDFQVFFEEDSIKAVMDIAGYDTKKEFYANSVVVRKASWAAMGYLDKKQFRRMAHAFEKVTEENRTFLYVLQGHHVYNPIE